MLRYCTLVSGATYWKDWSYHIALFIQLLSLSSIKLLQLLTFRHIGRCRLDYSRGVVPDGLLYLDKEKIQNLIAQQRKILAEVGHLDLNSVAKLIKDFKNPKLPEENLKKYSRPTLCHPERTETVPWGSWGSTHNVSDTSCAIIL